MEDEKIVLYTKREFLNRDINLISAVLAEVYVDSRWTTTDFELSNCEKTFRLDFASDEDEERYVNDLHKIDILIDTLIDFKAAFIESRKMYLVRKEEFEEKRKKVDDEIKEAKES